MILNPSNLASGLSGKSEFHHLNQGLLLIAEVPRSIEENQTRGVGYRGSIERDVRHYSGSTYYQRIFSPYSMLTTHYTMPWSSEVTVAQVLESRCPFLNFIVFYQRSFSGTTGGRNGCRRRVGGFIRTWTSRGTVICEMFVTVGLARAARSASEHASRD
jgi:hypothetical protein